MKKGQAAVEFLMTYGWAIMVVIVAVGALAYFGVLSPSKFIPEKCSFPAGMDCVGKATINTSGLTFVIANNLGSNIDVTAVAVSGTGSCQGGATVSYYVCNFTGTGGCNPLTQLPMNPMNNTNNNDRITVKITGCNPMTLGSKFKDTITITYTNKYTGLSLKATGDIIGAIS